MHVEFERSGGVAGVVLRATVDPADLAPQELALLGALTAEGTAPAHAGSGPPGACDRFQYRLEIVDGEHRRSFAFGEGDAPLELRPVLERLTDLALGR